MLGKLIGAPAGEQGKTAITAAITEAEGTAKALIARVKLPEGISDAEKDSIHGTIEALADMPGGVLLLRQIRADYAERGIKLEGAPAESGKWTKETLKEASKDPRYDPSSPKFDKKFRGEVDEAYKRIYG